MIMTKAEILKKYEGQILARTMYAGGQGDLSVGSFLDDSLGLSWIIWEAINGETRLLPLSYEFIRDYYGWDLFYDLMKEESIENEGLTSREKLHDWLQWKSSTPIPQQFIDQFYFGGLKSQYFGIRFSRSFGYDFSEIADAFGESTERIKKIYSDGKEKFWKPRKQS
jgi:hypothetical protein